MISRQEIFREVLKKIDIEDTTSLSILDVMESPKYFGNQFKGESWKVWKVILKAALCDGDLSDEEQEIFYKVSKRTTVPSGVKEMWCCCGRRAGKTYIASLIATYLAFFKDWSRYLSSGEVGIVSLIAPDRRQARVPFKYITGFIDSCPDLKKRVKRYTKEQIELDNNIVIEVSTCNYRTIRGYTYVAAICDEIAFWQDESSANPDVEILNALRPAMITVPDSLLICLSSPYAMRGVLWSTYKKYFGEENENILVIQAPTLVLNPLVPEEEIKKHYENDPVVADTEYGANFRRDIEGYVLEETVMACVENRTSLPFSSTNRYVAYVDPSGGVSDSFALCIAHREGDVVVVDLIREVKPPLSPDDVIASFSDILKEYRIRSAWGDRYSGEFVAQSFQKHGIRYVPVTKSKSEIYNGFLPLLNSGKVRLPKNRTLISQLLSLERSVSRGGREVIDHPPNAHDDVANCVAGACTLLVKPKANRRLTWGDAASTYDLDGSNNSGVRRIVF